MNSLMHNLSVIEYGIKLRFVEIEDAAFIVEMRNNPKLNAHITRTSAVVDEQKVWIREYKKREKIGSEYCFLTEDDVGNKLGTVSLHSFMDEKAQVGGWIFIPESPRGAAVKAYVLCLQIAFEILGLKVCTLNVRKKNVNVHKFHLSFDPIFINEDELNLYYELPKDKFYKKAKDILGLFGFTMQNIALKKEDR